MKYSIYQVDAFASELFKGNPAAVCPLAHWLEDEILQNIAAENNLAETAFIIKREGGYDIRWFTPTVEVDLCGHATLASAFIVFSFLEKSSKHVSFYSSRSGELTVDLLEDTLVLNFPIDLIEEIPLDPQYYRGLNIEPKEVYKGKSDYMLIYDSEEQILNLKPDFPKLSQIQARGVIVTSVGKDVDFVSRYFGPQSGGDEDAVTGSAHTSMVPYWARVLNKNTFRAKQLSTRGGDLYCTLIGDRVSISGKCILYMKGEIYLS